MTAPLSQVDAYLSSISPDRLDKAIAYTHGSHWVLVISKVLACAIALAIARAGLVATIQQRWLSRSGPNRTVFVCGLITLGLQSLILLPWSYFADHVRDVAYGLTHESSSAWFAQQAVSIVFSALAGAILLCALLALMRRTGHLWWLWSTGLLGLVFIASTLSAPWISRLSNSYHPLPDGPVATALQQLAARAGIPKAQIVIYDGSRQSERYTATVLGSGARAQIAISDTVMRGDADMPAIRAVVAHEIGHDRHYHLLILALAITVLAGFGLWLADRIVHPIAMLVRRKELPVLLGEPASIPIILAFWAGFTLLTTPLVNTAMRWVETDADAYGLALAQEPDGAARALLATTTYRAPSPSRLEEILFYDHPAIRNRLATAMKWKALHQPGTSADQKGGHPRPAQPSPAP